MTRQIGQAVGGARALAEAIAAEQGGQRRGANALGRAAKQGAAGEVQTVGSERMHGRWKTVH